MATQFIPHSVLRWRALFWVFFVGSLVRFVYFAEHGASPFFNVPLLDEKFYDSAAASLLGAGGLGELNPAFRSLGYPVFLAVCYLAGGESGRILAVAAQHLLGLATGLLVAWLAYRLFRQPAAGAMAAALYLLAGPPLYFEGELLAETLFTFQMTLVAVLLVRCASPAPAAGGESGSAGGRPWRWRAPWLLAGGAIGWAAQTRPNALVAVAALAALAAWQLPAGRRLPAAAAGLLGALGALLLCAAAQRPVVGSFELLPSQGGVNLYLGNKRGADGMIPRQEAATSYGDSYRDSVQMWSEQVFRQERGRPPASPSELSRFWTAKTWDEIRAAPGAWLALMGRKSLYLLSSAEIPNNKSYQFALAQESRLLPLMPAAFYLVLGASLIGAVAAWRPSFWRREAGQEANGDPAGRGPAKALLLLLLALALGAILFFVNARFRLPLWPLLAAFGGGVLGPHLPPRPRGAGWLVLAAAVLLSAISLLGPPRPEQLPGLGRDYFFRSLAYYEKGQFAAARSDAERAVSLEPQDAAARVQLGNTALAAGDTEAAYASFGQAVALLPAEPRGFHNLGLVFQELGKEGDAYAAYLRAIALSDDFSPPYVHAALLEIRAGLLDRAEAHLDAVATRAGDTVPYLCARAFLLVARRDDAAAQPFLLEALRRDRPAVERLVAESQRPLKFSDGQVK